jgi:hypothetical protein
MLSLAPPLAASVISIPTPCWRSMIHSLLQVVLAREG